MRVLITGVAGFIGFSLARELLDRKCHVYGIDNIDNYYSIKYKNFRLNFLKKKKNFFFYKINICNRNKIIEFFKNKKFDYIFHFAAQAGVRFSDKNPKKYVDTNVYGYLNILDAIKKKPKCLFYASSSSVYGERKQLPAKEVVKADPINIYASTKYLNEIISEFYSRTFDIKAIGLRFFTVYGEWGRPDMFLFKLFKNFFNKGFFNLNNSGNHKRDFTYINDVVQIIIFLMNNKKIKNQKHIIFNVCSNNPVNIKNVIELIKKYYGFVRIKNVKKNKLDIMDTHGSNYLIKKYTNFKKFTSIKKAIKNTFFWYAKYKIYKY
jgi:UDP-glucuronate 4-epimerase